MQIRCTAWTLAQLLALTVDETFPMQHVAPWRIRHPLTAGLVAQWLRIEFTGLPFRDGFDRKSQNSASQNSEVIRVCGFELKIATIPVCLITSCTFFPNAEARRRPLYV